MAEEAKNGRKIKPKYQMMLKSMMNLVDMYSNVVPNLVMSERSQKLLSVAKPN